MGLEFNNQNTLKGLGTTNVFSNLLSSQSLVTDISKLSPTIVQTAENLLNSPKTGTSTVPATSASPSAPVARTSSTQPVTAQETSPATPTTQPSLTKPLIYAGLGTGALLAIKYGLKIGALIIGGVVLYSFISTEFKGASV